MIVAPTNRSHGKKRAWSQHSPASGRSPVQLGSSSCSSHYFSQKKILESHQLPQFMPFYSTIGNGKKKHPGFPALKHLTTWISPSAFSHQLGGFPTPTPPHPVLEGLATFGAGKGSGFVVTLVGTVARVNQKMIS